MFSTQTEPVKYDYISVYDPRIGRGTPVFLKYDYEQRAYGCMTVTIVQPGSEKNLYCTVYVNGFHQPVLVPYHAISYDRL